MTSPPEALRIGGEFEFVPQAYDGPLAVASAWSAASPCLWTDLGRSALLIAAAAILQRGGRPRAWLPAFSCASISQPFRQAGFELEYYASGASLTGEPEALPQPDAGDTLLFIHYFGHRNETMAAAAREFRAAGVWIVEDCVQASLAPQLGEHSDFAITSHRKFLPVVDGAALLSRSPLDPAAIGLELQPPDESFVSARLVAKMLRGAGAAAPAFLPLLDRTETALEGRIVPRRMSWLSTWMMERLDMASVIAKRRANWLALAQRIADAGLGDHLLPVFAALPDEAVPLGLPVRVANGRRSELRRHLAEREIYCPVHWPLDHLPQARAYPHERALEQSLLTLPIDQRMSARHVERLAAELIAFFRNCKPSR